MVLKIASGFLGSIVILIGVVMLPLPGPGLLIIAGGIAILARHFEWAKRLQDKVKGFIKRRSEKKSKTAEAQPEPPVHDSRP
ncbi:MAG TPA: PGPGW domain-containing protein [Methylomirabilota bacterium]|nr:PGPGW domain-containing protein [Methylomirabilota bacterium]